MSPFDIPVFADIEEVPERAPIKKKFPPRMKGASPKPKARPEVEVGPNDPGRTPPMVNNWKSKPYAHNSAMKEALARAHEVQPSLISIFKKTEE